MCIIIEIKIQEDVKNTTKSDIPSHKGYYFHIAASKKSLEGILKVRENIAFIVSNNERIRTFFVQTNAIFLLESCLVEYVDNSEYL